MQSSALRYRTLTDSPISIFIENNDIKNKVINIEQLKIYSYGVTFLRFLRDL